MQQAFLDDILARLERTGLIYAVTGSVASNFWGLPRTTHDVDIVVVLAASSVPAIVAAFADKYYVSESGVRDAVLQSSMFNVIDAASNLKADLWVAAGEPFTQSMLARRRQVELVPGRQAFVGTPEDVLLHKLVWHTITPSERQLGDAAGIAAVQAGNLDLDYLRDWAARQGTSTLLEDVLQGKYLKKT